MNANADIDNINVFGEGVGKKQLSAAEIQAHNFGVRLPKSYLYHEDKNDKSKSYDPIERIEKLSRALNDTNIELSQSERIDLLTHVWLLVLNVDNKIEEMKTKGKLDERKDSTFFNVWGQVSGPVKLLFDGIKMKIGESEMAKYGRTFKTEEDRTDFQAKIGQTTLTSSHHRNAAIIGGNIDFIQETYKQQDAQQNADMGI